MATQHLGLPDDLQSETKHLAAIINYIALPPNLPQSEDVNLTEIEDVILRLARRVALTLPTTLSTKDHLTWQPVVGMLFDRSEIKQGGDLRDDILISKLSTMSPGDCLALHLTAQNTGLFLRRDHADSVIFECFEAAPTSESVITTEGRLLRTFPGRAVACPASLLSDNHFRDQLATTLRRLNNEVIDICAASTTKAGSQIREERDTTDPALVVDYLMNMLSALGENIESVPTQKCTRDDVLWSATSMPWRTAPFWLVLKVTVQRVLVACMTSSDAKQHYKMFMAVLLARVLDLALEARLSSDIVTTIHTKLARRVYKFEKDFGKMPVEYIRAMSQKARQFMDEAWLESQTKAHRTIPSLSLDSWRNATSLTLPRSRPILTAISAAKHVQSSSSSFVPSSQTRIAQDPEQLPSLGLRSSLQNMPLVLADFESWVQDPLAAWTQLPLNTSSSSQACNELADLVRVYWTFASSQYKISPLEMSEALLVVHELWVALDKLCVARVPFLREYPPEIPQVSLQPLLLPKKEQMLRLDAVESYVDQRQTRSCPVTSIFQNPEKDSFCVRYYDYSDEHKKIREKIAHHDAVKRRVKLEELTRQSAKYEKLLEDASKLAHTFGPNKSGYQVHYRSCEKCALSQEASKMKISVDEKSLPENLIQLKAAVFELATPPDFAAWRDVTWMILHDVGQRKTKHGLPKHVTLQNYPQLRDYIQYRSRQSRITLASVEKSYVATHYREQSFPVSEESVCVNNGLRYRVWDNVCGIWLSDSTSSSNLKSHCTLRLPPGPYANLEWASRTSSHNANEVIAKQDECDTRLRIREYIAFGSMRSGERIQWLNMLRELGCSDLDHNALAVNSLFLQAAWEAGMPSGDVLRQAHVEFGYPLFCRKLLFVLRNRIDAIEAS